MKMEITKLNIITDFVSPISKVPQFYSSFWKWGALLFAIFATFTSLFARIKLYIIRLHSIKHSSSISPHHLLQQLSNDSDFSDDDNNNDDDESNSLSATESVDEEFNSLFAYNDDDDQTPYKADEDYSVAGLYSYRECWNQSRQYHTNVVVTDSEYQGSDTYTISELFTTGKSVVKQWDDLGLGLALGFHDNFTCELSIYDICKDDNDICNGVKIGAYDRRIRAENPVMYAEWGSSFGKVVGVRYGGVEKVYVKHGGAGGACTVGDLRNFRNPLKVLKTSLEKY